MSLRKHKDSSLLSPFPQRWDKDGFTQSDGEEEKGVVMAYAGVHSDPLSPYPFFLQRLPPSLRRPRLSPSQIPLCLHTGARNSALKAGAWP